MANLKKKFPSLRVGVLVIAAFALLGSMMIPSIGEKMGLNESLCFGSGSGSGSGYGYGSEYEYDAMEEYLDCIDNCDRNLEALLSAFEDYCDQKYEGNERASEMCFESWRAACEAAYLIAVDYCEEEYLKYPDTPPWERP